MDALQHQEFVPSSVFESLPCRVLFKVIEYVPEMAMEMRMASKMLAHTVDDYAKNVNIPMVERMTFGVFRLPGMTIPDNNFNVMFNVAPKTRGLFFRRLNLLQSTFGENTMSSFEAYKELLDTPRTEGEKKFDAERKARGEEIKPASMTRNVRMNFDLNAADIDAQLALLGECLGNRIAKVQVVNSLSEVQFDAMEKVIASKQIHTMQLATSDMLDEDMIHLMRFVMMHNVDTVEFGVNKFDSKMKTDMMGCLRELSTQIRSLHITQHKNNDGNNAQGTFLLGQQKADWGQLIVDMFSEKIDKIVIDNKHNMDYLSLNGAEKLVEKLPELKKPLWFEATCDKFADGFERNESGFAMQADKTDANIRTGPKLIIKHEARGPIQVDSSFY